MVALPNVSSQDGPRVTMNTWLQDPLMVPEYVIDIMKQGLFLPDAVLRSEGQAPSGAVVYNESSPLYADTDVEDRGEFAEVPMIESSDGQPAVAFAVEKSLAVGISDRDKRRSRVDKLSARMQRAKNTMTRTWDDVFMAAIRNNPNKQTLAATAPWSTDGYDIRKDILTACKLIGGALDVNGNEFGFEPDTLIVNRATKFDLLISEQFNKPYYGGNIADQNLKYTGKLPNQIVSLDTLFCSRVPYGTAIVMQRKVAGAIVDEVPLEMTALYRDEPRKMSRADMLRSSVVFLDQPKAVCVINGVSQ